MTLRTTRGSRLVGLLALATGAALALSACATATDTTGDDAQNGSASTVTITDNHGEVEVPVRPETVVALDNHVFQTLSDWGVELAAVPKGVMGSVWPEYTDNEDVADVGAHFEPNLETIVAAQPQLIIGGYRFGQHYDAIVEQNPQAKVIEIAPRDGEDLVSELKRENEILGQIFDREKEAQALSADLDQAMADAKAAYPEGEKVMALNTSAGNIGYIAPGVGRSIGPIFSELGLAPALEVDGATNDHQGDDISVEAIAASNPDWIIVLDRDAAFAPEDREAGSAPAKELIEKSEALKNVPAVQKGRIIVLDPNFYLTEDIQAYTALFTQIQAAFAAA